MYKTETGATGCKRSLVGITTLGVQSLLSLSLMNSDFTLTPSHDQRLDN
jgi:hypothetical protein